MKFDQYGPKKAPVPCATCGMLSTSVFPDGSPLWPAHDHDALPKPYYKDDLVTLYHGDAARLASSLPIADVLVMDPPFDKWSAIALEQLAVDGSRLSGTTTVAFTTWQHRPPVHRIFGQPRAELIWAFADGRWVSHQLPRITHETILVFGPTGSAYVGPLTDGVPVRKGTGAIGRDNLGPRTYTPHERKALDSVQHFPRDVSGPLGVWSKPLGLMSRLLEWLAQPGALVVDPFAGSGTTLVAAKALGLRAVGVEIDEGHCEVAANRCRQETLGLSA